MNTDELRQHVVSFWDETILPTLTEYITIPNESPNFDKEWAAHGHMDKAVKLVADWMRRHGPEDMKLEVLRGGSRTPLILAEVPGGLDRTVLFYGHLDKQPPMTGWREGLGPWSPMLDDQGRLYGRGGGDDGYSAFAAIATANALRAAGQAHGRLVMLIECSEESGSSDLPHYLKAYAGRIGKPDLLIGLDSGAGNYEQLWSTTSLRGILEISLKVEVLSEGVHSGIAGGIVPSPIRIARLLLDRLEDARTGKVLPPEVQVEIPQGSIEQARQTARVLGGSVATDYPFVEGAQPQEDKTEELLLNNTWRPSLAITGQEGIPATGKGGNVLYPFQSLKISLRIPPGIKPSQAGAAIKKLLLANPPHGARVTVTAGGVPGWAAPPFAPWLLAAMDASSQEFYGKPACHFGLGGTIPFMTMIGDKFPDAQFLITGVLGPHSNAHGPNEFLHVPYAKELTCCLVRIVAAHHAQFSG